MDPIDASSVASLHAAFKASRAEFEAAVQVADPRWEEQLLEPEDGGDEPWPPHMAAAHALLGERWRFRYLAALIATPKDGPLLTQQTFAVLPSEQLELSERPARYESLSDATSTLTAAIEEWATIDAVFARFTESDLDREADISPGQLGYLASQSQPSERDVRSFLRLAAVHPRDHAQQLRSVLNR
ncbi:MAG: hypothetical protein HOH95_05650 [Dehalococcoidia bacterium]|nr:hypothetical protein [Dehalococcoidia bacterium]